MPDLSVYYFLQAVVIYWNAFREKRKLRVHQNMQSINRVAVSDVSIGRKPNAIYFVAERRKRAVDLVSRDA